MTIAVEIHSFASGPMKSWSEQTSAYDRALQQHLADIPDPAMFAATLPHDIVAALANATRRPEGFYVHPTDVAQLRRLGLCDCSSDRHRGRLLTVFGMKVRRAIIEGHQP